MKKLIIILAAAFLLSVFQPAAAAEADIYQAANEAADGYIVKLSDSPSDTASLMEDSNLTEISADANLYRADSLSDISKLGDAVLYYEPDCTVTLSELPNDTYAAKQWSIDSLGITSAWDAGYDGEGIKIAVIDSGVNSLHEDFFGTDFGVGYNATDGSNNVTDENGHGTFVTGVIAAARDNEAGIAGFCSQAMIIPIKCFGKSTETSASYIISAIYEAVDVYDCDVINMSLGMEENMVSMATAVDYATGKGTIIVSAVGNEGNSTLNYPAAYDCVIGVGAVDLNGAVPNFSEKNESVFVVAPGSDIISLSSASSHAYSSGSGTSYSTPFVSVAAVILKQYAPNATVSDFKTLLQASSIDGGPDGYDTSYGYGKLNIENFVAVMKNYSFEEIGTIFPDVEGHWAASSIDFCFSSGLFTGTTSSTFEPETVMNRAMFVTVLSRMSGETISGFALCFSDVAGEAWYAQPSAWGAANGVVSGTGSGKFDPLGAVTREQMAVFLYRYAKRYGLTDGSFSTAALSAFSDAGSVSSWAAEAMSWAVEKGLITGRSASTLSPKESTKRCEVATIISRFVNTLKA